MMNIDVSYGEYFDVFCGNQTPVLSAELFDGYIKGAKLFLKAVMQDDEEDNYREDIKSCLCALAEELYLEQKQGRIKNESIDGYSVAYSQENPVGKRLLKIALIYLDKTGLLYAGVK